MTPGRRPPARCGGAQKDTIPTEPTRVKMDTLLTITTLLQTQVAAAAKEREEDKARVAVAEAKVAALEARLRDIATERPPAPVSYAAAASVAAAAPAPASALRASAPTWRGRVHATDDKIGAFLIKLGTRATSAAFILLRMMYGAMPERFSLNEPHYSSSDALSHYTLTVQWDRHPVRFHVYYKASSPSHPARYLMVTEMAPHLSGERADPKISALFVYEGELRDAWGEALPGWLERELDSIRPVSRAGSVRPDEYE